MSIDRSFYGINRKHRITAAGTAVVAALVMTLSPFSLARASEITPLETSLPQVSAKTAKYEETQNRIQSIPALNASEIERYKEEAQKKAEEEAAAEAKAQAEAEAASYTYVEASMYGEGDGCMGSATASGEIVTSTSMAVAMKTMPLGTVIQLTYNGNTVTAVVNDRGPYVGNRQIDLQPAVAHALGFSGVGTVGYKIVS